MMDMRQGRDGRQRRVYYQASYHHVGKESSIAVGKSQNLGSELIQSRGWRAGVFIHQFTIGSGCFQGNQLSGIFGFPMPGYSMFPRPEKAFK